MLTFVFKAKTVSFSFKCKDKYFFCFLCKKIKGLFKQGFRKGAMKKLNGRNKQRKDELLNHKTEGL